MIKKRLKGFSLIEIIVVISISSIILSSLFYLFSNINILNKFTTVKTEKSIEFAYFYHLIRNDLSNSVPGIINNENSIYLKDQNNLINYGFNIFRDSLKVWAFNVTALEPFFNGNQCEVFYDTPTDFKSFFKSIFTNNIKSSNKIKKI